MTPSETVCIKITRAVQGSTLIAAVSAAMLYLASVTVLGLQGVTLDEILREFRNNFLMSYASFEIK